MYLSLGIIIVISKAEWSRVRMLMDAAWWDKCLAAGGLLSQRILPLQWRLRIPRIPNGPFEILETKQMSIEEWNADPTSSYSFPSGPLHVLGLRYSKIYNHSTAVEINIPSITVVFDTNIFSNIRDEVIYWVVYPLEQLTHIGYVVLPTKNGHTTHHVLYGRSWWGHQFPWPITPKNNEHGCVGQSLFADSSSLTSWGYSYI